MTDEFDTNEEQPQAPEPAESEEGPKDERSLKEELREGAAKAFGLAVEVGSLLSGESGEIVEAEKELAADKAEDFIDRIDGEG